MFHSDLLQISVPYGSRMLTRCPTYTSTLNQLTCQQEGPVLPRNKKTHSCSLLLCGQNNVNTSWIQITSVDYGRVTTNHGHWPCSMLGLGLGMGGGGEVNITFLILTSVSDLTLRTLMDPQTWCWTPGRCAFVWMRWSRSGHQAASRHRCCRDTWRRWTTTWRRPRGSPPYHGDRQSTSSSKTSLTPSERDPGGGRKVPNSIRYDRTCKVLYVCWDHAVGCYQVCFLISWWSTCSVYIRC